MGLEVLEARSVFGSKPPHIPELSARARLLFDGVANALYLRVQEAPVARQEVCESTFYLDEENTLLRVDFEREGE